MNQINSKAFKIGDNNKRQKNPSLPFPHSSFHSFSSRIQIFQVVRPMQNDVTQPGEQGRVERNNRARRSGPQPAEVTSATTASHDPSRDLLLLLPVIAPIIPRARSPSYSSRHAVRVHVLKAQLETRLFENLR